MPRDIQGDLHPVDIGGNPEFRVNPTQDDFYCRVIDLRMQIREQQKEASGHKAMQLDADQLGLKIVANSTSYGIFVELNPDKLVKRAPATCYGAVDSFPIMISNLEEPGRYFHALLATLITGTARLMLAIAE